MLFTSIFPKLNDIIKQNKLTIVRLNTYITFFKNFLFLKLCINIEYNKAPESTTNNSQVYNLLLKRINEQLNSRYYIGNSLLDSLQKLNIQKAQNLRINEHKIFEMKQRLKQL